MTWTCTADRRLVVRAASGVGDIATTVTLLSGGGATFVATTLIASSAIGPQANTATVTAPAGTTDPQPANNTVTATVEVTASADVQITKTGPASVVPGTTVVYTITVTNTGPSDAASVEVTDATPTGLTFVSNTGDCLTAFPCALGTVAGGRAATRDHGDLLGAGELHDARSHCEHRDGVDRDGGPGGGQQHGGVPDGRRSPSRPGDHEDRSGIGRPGHERGLHDHGHQRWAIGRGERGRHRRDAGRADLRSRTPATA